MNETTQKDIATEIQEVKTEEATELPFDFKSNPNHYLDILFL